MKAQEQISLFYNVVGELEGIECFFKHLYHTDPKVHNIIHHIL
jgi:hypothetical protein